MVLKSKFSLDIKCGPVFMAHESFLLKLLLQWAKECPQQLIKKMIVRP